MKERNEPVDVDPEANGTDDSEDEVDDQDESDDDDDDIVEDEEEDGDQRMEQTVDNVTNTEDMDDKNDDDREGPPSRTNTNKNSNNSILLSKSWSVQTAHAPLYTGGKITALRLLHSNHHHYPSSSTTTATVDGHGCLMTPVFGDVSFTDCHSSVRLGMVRKSNRQQKKNEKHDDNDDDDDDMMDMDAIVAYAVAPNQGTTLVTCSQNHMMRQYSMGVAAAAAETDPIRVTTDPSSSKDNESPPPPQWNVRLEKQWGLSGHSLPVTDLQFHISGVFVSTASVDGSVRVWDVRGGFVTHCFRPPNDNDIDDSIMGRGRAVTAMAWFPQAHHLILAVARDNGSIVIHNLRKDNDSNGNNNDDSHGEIIVLRDHISAVTCMAWHLPTTTFVTAGRDSVINLWKFETEPSVAAATASISSKKSKKGIASQNGPRYTRLLTVPVYEQVEGMVLLTSSSVNVDTFADRSNDSAIAKEDSVLWIATAGSKGQIRVWRMRKPVVNDYAKKEKTLQLKLIGEQTNGFGQTRGGYLNLLHYKDNQLVVGDAEHNITYVTVDLKATSTDKVLTIDRTIVGHNDEILDLKVIPNAHSTSCGGTIPSNALTRKIVVATNSAQVRIFNLDTFACDILDGHTATVLCVDVSPCGRYVATCGKDKQMRVWNTRTNSCVAVALGHTEAVGSTALSRKVGRYDVAGKAAKNGGGAFVATVSIDRTLKRWNLPGSSDLDNAVETGLERDLKAMCSARAHEKDINVVTIAPNDSLIATGSQDKTVKLWKATDLSSVATLKGHRRGVWDICFSPFDRIVATGSGDKTIKLWSLSDFSCVRTFQGHVSSVLRVRFLSGGLQLVSSGADGLVKLWTVRTNESEATLDLHRDKVWALDLAPNGKELISGGADSQIVVWNDTTKLMEDTKHAEEEEAILVDQKLANHMRRKEYVEALEISLDRDKPHQTLKVLNAIIEADLQKGLNGVTSLKTFTKSWTMDRLVRLLQYCREWNTRARNAHVALLTIKVIATTVPAHTLAAAPGVPEILAGIVPYAERHFDRLDRLHSSSYLFDFALSSMGAVEASSEGDEFTGWEPKLVLPPTTMDGRLDIGGNAVVGATINRKRDYPDSDDDVVTLGDSDESEEDS